MKKILLLEDEELWADLLKDVLSLHGLVSYASTIQEARTLLKQKKFDIVFCDLNLHGEVNVGAKIVDLARRKGIYSVVVSSNDDDETIDYCISECGARDYFIKPSDPDDLRVYIREIFKGFERSQKEDLAKILIEEKYFSTDRSVKDYLFNKVKRINENSNGVLIVGETGTGKTLLASEIVAPLIDSNLEIVRFDCGAFSSELIDSELFGYVKGSHSQALKDSKGKVEAARGGILFLDDIQNLSIKGQQNLRTIIEDGFFYPVGSNEPRYIDLTLICAGTDELDQKVENKEFRLDVYHRLARNRIDTTPLQDRPNDILPLIKFFARQLYPKGKAFVLKDDVKEILQGYSWPGNIREIKHTVEGWADNNYQSISVEHIDLTKFCNKGAQIGALTPSQKSYLSQHGYKEFMNFMREKAMQYVLENTESSAEAAKNLGINRSSVSRFRKNLNQETPTSFSQESYVQ